MMSAGRQPRRLSEARLLVPHDSSLPELAFFNFSPKYFLFVRAFFKVLYADFSVSSFVMARALIRSAGLGTGMISFNVFCATFCSSDLGVSPCFTPFAPDFLGKTNNLDLYNLRRLTFS